MNLNLLKQKNFFLLMLGKFVSLLGSKMQAFALSLYVLNVTKSTVLFSSVLIVAGIPRVILGPIAGVFVDWLDRKKIIVCLDFLSGIIVGIYAVVFMLYGTLPMYAIYLLAMLLAIISVVFDPAISTVIPTIVKEDDLVDANGMNSMIMNLSAFISPALAGILLGFSGLGVILIVNSISFILSAVSEMFIDIPKSNKRPEKITVKAFRDDFTEGINIIKNNRLLLNIVFIGLLANFAYNPVFSIGLPHIMKKVLFVTDYQFGILQSTLVIATMSAPIVTSYISNKIDIKKILYYDLLFQPILICFIALVSAPMFLGKFSNNIIPYLLILMITLIVVAIVSVGNISLITLFQKNVPNEAMGRVGTVLSTGVMAAIPIGQAIFGLMFDKIDSWICLSIASAILMINVLASKKALCQSSSNSRDMDNLIKEQ